jgi:hypothetical protein
VPRLLLSLLLLAAGGSAGSALGMGLSEDEPTERIPEPSLNFRFRVTDTEMTKFEVVRASFDGHIYLTGAMGKARVSVPFEKIERVIFEPTGEGRDMLAMVTLKGGGQQNLVVNGSTPCFGEADFGNVQIEIRHLREALVLGRVD